MGRLGFCWFRLSIVLLIWFWGGDDDWVSNASHKEIGLGLVVL
jgi:hypothetical protein